MIVKNFQVSIMDRTGKTQKEYYVAQTPENLKRVIKEKGLYLIDFKEIRAKETAVTKLKVKHLVVFTRQLSTMIASGIPIIKALDMLQNKAMNKKTKTVFREIFEDVQKGNSLSDAMLLQKGAFPELLTNMVQAGELGGTLDRSLERMSSHFEKEAKLSSKIKSASIYPAILGVVSIVVVLLLVTFVLPTITAMFDPEKMPWSTKLILGFSDFLIGNWFAIIFAIVLFFVGSRIALTVRSIRVAVDRLKLRLPIFGRLNRTVYSAR